MSGSAATSDLVKLALALLQSGAARNAQQSIKSLIRVALLQTVAAFCVIAALGCALGALWIYAAPILGGAGALLAAPGAAGDASLAAAASLFKQHVGLALVAALLAGVFVGSER